MIKKYIMSDRYKVAHSTPKNAPQSEQKRLKSTKMRARKKRMSAKRTAAFSDLGFDSTKITSRQRRVLVFRFAKRTVATFGIRKMVT